MLPVEELDGAGDDVGAAVAVTVTRAVSVAVAVVVVVAVATGGVLTEALAVAVGEADGPDVMPAVALAEGVCDRDGKEGRLAVGRLTAGPVSLRLGVGGVRDWVGRPLAPTVAETDGAATVRVGDPEPSPACPQPAMTNPTTLTAATTRTRIIIRS